ncbi:hypothetical protein C3747_9g2020c [Trypanosoma cruzi]|uniref:Stress-response A/B barrel domain-containing protein n=3 Tax=Trypanosoma cruzi TaxID=5693 RepID=Q4CZP5_TRYCC|nr:hypothetical protein, conserved [Trypanosoma cruzi]ESS64341.1 hypothetical protein TCDM_14371 [Trypanosoma cruzi Dm28c]PBJ79175.1 hypothetical protein BCY84_03126 [Trypanosoma cruzi cruzi]EAN85749.1 hypothetical protein, conserved [Trypanosoma cruzi]KAF8284470.1 putative Stress responsive A/B Barrel Domain [Trypanosoma cruzi]PWU96238.1 hypothetical protein C4B63_19g1437c [Trypanosoma cruzi]|eukprot:XP_807600.1 hypothetical protein [Trypanosoma cruzi strain CL Brener]
MQPKICHVVFFRLDPAKVTTLLPTDVLQRHLSVLREKVPGLLELNFGPTGTNLYPNYVDCSNGYTHCLVSKHADADKLKVYAEHPDHVVFANLLKSSSAAPPIRIDFELSASNE